MSNSITKLIGKGKFASGNATTKLMGLGYSTIEEVVAASALEPDLINKFLGFNVDEELTAAGFLEKKLRFSLLEASAKIDYPLGARLDHLPPKPFATVSANIREFLAPALPAKASLISKLPPLRDQGERGTCVAFATIAALERGTDDLSEQFVYAECKLKDKDPNEGTWLYISFPSVQADGVCKETTWRYNPKKILGNEGQGPIPQTAIAEARTNRHNYEKLDPNSVDAIKQAVAGGSVVGFSIPVFNTWYRNPVVFKTGDIVLPLTGETPISGHAMAIVGYADDAPAPGGGRFEIRNSWSGWAQSSKVAKGYGTLPYQYIAKYGTEAYRFTS